MIFREWYGAYYSAVAELLRAAVDHPVTDRELRTIIAANAFAESGPVIESALREERWPLLRADGTTPLWHAPTMPMTMLEKRWLKAVSLDPRVRLFDLSLEGLEEVEPLFRPEDIRVFDRYADGDPFEDEVYIRNFRLILNAIREETPLRIRMVNNRGGKVSVTVRPEFLEYSEKDDKFRLLTKGGRYGKTINLARILSCKPCDGEDPFHRRKARKPAVRTLVLEVFDGRNALERVMLHFAHFEKEAQRLDDRRYRLCIRYRRDDETELVIRVLSFGPFVRVVEPDSFVTLIKDRLRRQKSCGL